MYRMTAALFGAAATIALVQPQMAVALDPDKIAALGKEFTVQIEGEKKGSGVILERDGNTYTVLTNWHVVNREGQYQIVTIDGKKHAVTYSKIRYLPGIDIAILQFSSSELYRTAKLGDSEDMVEGKTIYVIGWGDPMAGIPERSYQVWEAKIVSRLQNPEKGYAIVHDNAATPGTSGGPVLDSKGRLVGLNGGSRLDLNTGKVLGLAIPMQIFLAGRNKLKPPPGILPTSPEDFDVKPPENVDINPRNAVAYYNRGNDYRRQGDYARAISEYNEAIRINPNYAYAYRNRGIAYRKQGEYSRAIADFNEAIRINPNYADAYFGRGLAYDDQGEYRRAIADYNEAIRIDPNYAQVYNNRGNAYYARKKYDRAIADYNESLRLKNPEPWIVYSNRGNAYRAQKKYSRAIADCNQAIRLDPNYASAYNVRGIAYRHQGEYSRALFDYSEAIRINPNYASPYYNRGRLYKKLRDKRRAIEDFRKAADLYLQQHGTDYLWYKRALKRIRELQ